MKNFILVGAVTLSLAACVAAPMEMSGPPQPAALLANAPMDRIIVDKTVNTTIRSFKMVANDAGKMTRVEVSGVRCSLQSDHLQTSIITPQAVVLPKYDQDKNLKDRGVPPSIAVNCNSGELSGQTLIAANPGKIVSGSGNLVADLILIAGSAAAATTANWRYAPEVSVTLK